VTELPKQIVWIGSSLEDLRRFPAEVKEEMGYALHLAQVGELHLNAKPLRGFGGASVLEIVSDHDGNTYRGVYTVRFRRAIYVLHAFQKKSKRGIQTPIKEIQMIRDRLKLAKAYDSNRTD
jgi:phage-related protein